MTDTHGVCIYEKATSIVAPIESDSGIIVAIGTAPINLVENLQEAVNTPVVCYSYAEAVKKLGYDSDFEKYTLCEVIDAAFRQFNICPIICINVLDPSKHKESIEDEVIIVLKYKAIIEKTGILPESVVVKNSTGTTYVKDLDYFLSFDDSGNLIVAINDENDISKETSLKVSYDKLTPENINKNDIIGGFDVASGKYKGFECISQIYPKFALIPGQIIAPKWSKNPEVAAVMKAKTTNISGLFKCICIADIDSDAANTYDKCNEWKNNNSYVDENMVVCWAKAKIGEKIYNMSTIWAAVTVKTDSNYENIPYKSPSNENLPITALINESGTNIYLDMNQANLLNSQGICTAINLNGWKSWGNNTSIYPSNTDVKDRFIPVRRFFNWWGNNFILTYFQKVDNPMNIRLINSIVDSENAKANGYKAKGIIADAKIEYNEEENPITDLLNGKIYFHQYLTPFPPAETITNTLEFDPSALKSALAG